MPIFTTSNLSRTQHCLGPGIPYTEVWKLHPTSTFDAPAPQTELQTPLKLSITPKNSTKPDKTPSSRPATKSVLAAAFVAGRRRQPRVPTLLRRLDSNAHIKELLNRWG